MRKLKIILPSIALIVVLSLSITIGVYAASSATFNITSTISFNSPNLKDVVVYCYALQEGENVTDEGRKPWFTYSTDATITGDGSLWDLKDHSDNDGNDENNKELSFDKRSTNNHYAPVRLVFVIKHKTELSLYAYFTKTTGTGEGALTERVTSDELYGRTQTSLKLIDATMTENITDGILGNTTGSETYTGGQVSIELALTPDATLVQDTVAINYTLVVSKQKPEVN